MGEDNAKLLDALTWLAHVYKKRKDRPVTGMNYGDPSLGVARFAGDFAASG